MRILSPNVEVLAEGLGHPEGPDVLPDGRVLFVNTFAGELVTYSLSSQELTTFAHTGGAPHACLRGNDGSIYVTQAPSVGEWIAPDPRVPSIQHLHEERELYVLTSGTGDHSLIAPNDLAFGPDGRLFFTDSGTWDPLGKSDPGHIYSVDRNGNCEIVETLDAVYPNGIVVEEDGSIVWVESYTRNVVRRHIDGRIELLHTLPPNHIPDGLKLDCEGNFWIATCSSGGIDVVSRSGQPIAFVETGGFPLNCVFEGNALFVCDGGRSPAEPDARTAGRLLRLDAGVAGMTVFRGSPESGHS